MFLLNSRLDLFSAAHSREHPFSRSYGVNLPSSLTTLLPLALEFSSYLPVSVCGTGILYIHKAFLACFHACFPTNFRSLSPGATIARVTHFLSVPLLKYFDGYGISTVCASATPLGLTLAPDLPGADEPSSRNLRLSAFMIHINRATHSGILTSVQSTRASAHVSPRTQRSPTNPYGFPSFGVMFSPVTFSAQSHSTSELLRTL